MLASEVLRYGALPWDYVNMVASDIKHSAGSAAILCLNRNLYDMAASAYDLAELFRCMERIASLAAVLAARDVPSDLDDPTLSRMSELCERIGLAQSLNRLGRIAERRREDGFSLASLGEQLRVLNETIIDELSKHRFIDVSNPSLYDAQDLFGDQVAVRFPDAAYHIREAGTCLSLDRGTASVYHAMCILEFGLDSLSYALALPQSEKSWHVILGKIETSIETTFHKASTTPKEDREFYSKAVLEFKYFRDAWRNHTAHGRAKFTTEEAKAVFNHVKDFMQHLAAQLWQRPHD